jgi:methylmalonyl-CoA mutase
MEASKAPSPLSPTPFAPTPDEAWEARLEKELRGADRNEKLVWQHPDGFPIEPYYRKAPDGSTPPAIPGLGSPKTWILRPRYVGAPSAVAIREADAAARSREAQGLDILLDATTAQTLADVLPEGWQVWLSGKTKPSEAGSWWMDIQCGQAQSGQAAGAQDWEALLDHLAGADGQNSGAYLDAAHWTDAGAHTPDVLAISLAAVAEWLSQAASAGMDPAEAAGKLQLRLAAGPLFFSELAAFRAWRVLWQLLGEAYQHADGLQASWPDAHIVGTASTWNLTRADRHSNLIRLSAQLMAAACGGADVLQAPRFDAAFAPQGELGSEGQWVSPDASAFSERISENLALLLRHESHLERVSDPGAGSWYLEHLTDAIGQQAWAQFQAIEKAGGYSAALKAGLLQGWTNEARSRTEADLISGKRTWIGINRFPNGMEDAPELPESRVLEGADFAPLQPWYPESVLRQAAAARAAESTASNHTPS